MGGITDGRHNLWEAWQLIGWPAKQLPGRRDMASHTRPIADTWMPPRQPRTRSAPSATSACRRRGRAGFGLLERGNRGAWMAVPTTNVEHSKIATKNHYAVILKGTQPWSRAPNPRPPTVPTANAHPACVGRQAPTAQPCRAPPRLASGLPIVDGKA